MFGAFGYRIVISDKINRNNPYYNQLMEKSRLIQSMEHEFSRLLESNKVTIMRKPEEIVDDIVIKFDNDIYFGSQGIEKLMLFIQNLLNKNMNNTGLMTSAFNEDDDDGGYGIEELNRLSGAARKFATNYKNPNEDRKYIPKMETKQQQQKTETENPFIATINPSQEYVKFNQATSLNLNNIYGSEKQVKNDDDPFDQTTAREINFMKSK